ncbi:MAG: AsmA family protein [Saprospiraceae bacterium]|nr:AsmA family protein [Saprospiraceae bacterium]
MTKGKLFKRIFLIVGVFLLLFIAALVAIPFFFKDEILEQVKKTANEQLKAKVDFNGVDISLLRSFPSVSIGLNDYSVTGIEPFEGVKLAAGESARVTVDFWSAWNFGKVPLNIQSITLDKPEINVIVLADGTANYDIAKPNADTSTTETNFQIQLQEYAINGGNITYDDRQGGTYVKLTGLDHSGEGDFTQDVFDLDTKTEIAEMTAESGGIGYLKKAKVKLDAGFNIDMPNSKYTLRENDLRINDLSIKADGWVAMPGEDIDMDLKFSAPKSEFKSLLSMIPNAYTAGYDNVKADGTFKLDGTVKGKLTAIAYPAFNILLDIAGGSVKYPDLPLGISNINTNIKVNSPGSDLDQMLVDVSKFSLKIGSNPLEGFFKLRTPMSDPDVDTKIKGVLNLEELSKAFPMEGVKSLSGIINSDIAVKTSMSTIDRGDYANVDMSGTASIKNMNYAADGMPAINIGAMQMDFTPQQVNVPSFSMKMGKSDLSGSGKIDNILAYFSPDKTMKGSFTLRSNYFNADEWMTEEEAPATTTAAPAPTASEEVFNRFDFTLDASVGKVDYDVYKIENLVAKGNFTPNALKVNQLSGKLGQSDFNASGTMTNIWNYLFENETLGGNLAIRSSYMNLNQFMTEEGAAQTATPPAEAAEPILVPDNIDMKVSADIATVIYDDMELKNMKGTLSVKNEEVRFDNLTANSMGGSMNIAGGYNTKNHEKPKFDFLMKLKNIDFQQAFAKFNTFQLLAPIGKYLTGTFNTDLTMSSDLKKDLMPDIGTITAKGLLETLNGKITLAKPLREVGNKLNVDAFKKLDLKNSKNWFKVQDGAVMIDPFSQTVDGIKMDFSGSHKLVGDMDYKILAKIPRSKIGKSAIGAAANTGVDFLAGEASKLGLNLSAGEFYNVQINLGGTMDNPKVTFKVLGAEGTAEAVKDAVVSKVKEEAQKELDKAKAEAQAKLDEEKKRLEAEAQRQIDKATAEAKKKLEAEAKKRLDDEAKKAADKALDKAGKEAKDKAKDALDKIKIPGKKDKDKKGGGG